MSGRWTKKFSFLFGAALGPDDLLLAAVQDEAAQRKMDLTLLLRWQTGKWQVVEPPLLDAAVGLAADYTHSECMALGLHGRVQRFRWSDTRLEPMPVNDVGSPDDPPILRSLALVEGVWFAAGMGREVYQLQGRNWVAIDHSIKIAEPGIEPVGFQAVAGYSTDEMYAAGFAGEIWSRSKGRWHQEQSPTNLALDTAFSCPDGLVRIAGKSGVLLEGRHVKWRTIPHTATDSEFFGSAWFQGRLHLSTSEAVFHLVGEELEISDFGNAGAASCMQITADDHNLWSIGPKDLLCFDGRKWRRID